MHDTYLECVLMPDGTPEEMAAFFVSTVNAACDEERTGISRRYKMPMDVALGDGWFRPIKDKYFVFLEWRTTKFTTYGEFFGEEMDNDQTS